jgi:hypothetical protein
MRFGEHGGDISGDCFVCYCLPQGQLQPNTWKLRYVTFFCRLCQGNKRISRPIFLGNPSVCTLLAAVAFNSSVVIVGNAAVRDKTSISYLNCLLLLYIFGYFDASIECILKSNRS